MIPAGLSDPSFWTDPVWWNNDVAAELRPTGSVDWNLRVDDMGLGAVLWDVLRLVNRLINLIVFRGGVTIRVYRVGTRRTKPICEVRYRNQAAACADLKRQIALGIESVRSES